MQYEKNKTAPIYTKSDWDKELDKGRTKKIRVKKDSKKSGNQFQVTHEKLLSQKSSNNFQESTKHRPKKRFNKHQEFNNKGKHPK